MRKFHAALLSVAILAGAWGIVYAVSDGAKKGTALACLSVFKAPSEVCGPLVYRAYDSHIDLVRDMRTSVSSRTFPVFDRLETGRCVSQNPDPLSVEIARAVMPLDPAKSIGELQSYPHTWMQDVKFHEFREEMASEVFGRSTTIEDLIQAAVQDGASYSLAVDTIMLELGYDLVGTYTNQIWSTFPGLLKFFPFENGEIRHYAHGGRGVSIYSKDTTNGISYVFLTPENSASRPPVKGYDCEVNVYFD